MSARARDVVEVDGASHSGSGTIVRQAVTYAAITRRPVHIVRAREKRQNPGLRHQHLCAVHAVRDIVGGSLEGARLGSQELWFRPGGSTAKARYEWEIGSAGSATALVVALLPLLATRDRTVEIEVRGSLFQDHAPTAFHVQHALLHLAARMAIDATATIVRPGYVPRGEGILRLVVTPPRKGVAALRYASRKGTPRLWGTSLASHLVERRVAQRMAAAARVALSEAGHTVTIAEIDDTSARQAGAALALFADFDNGARLGTDLVGAPHRRAERIGDHVARMLLAEIATGCDVDRHCADQLIPLAALASGPTMVRIPAVTEHVASGLWLAHLFLGVDAGVERRMLTVHGTHERSRRARAR